MEKICRKCLLAELTDVDHAKHIYEYIAALPDDVRAADVVIEERLAVCRTCDSLVSAMCKHCGCYVEVRAAKRVQMCPHPVSRW